jgi:hypothetical protein
MPRFTIQYIHETGESCCPTCGVFGVAKKGPGLVPVDGEDPVCRACAQRLAPDLVALLDLAHVAERVGRRGRHMLTPSMESLLDLARAAENYSQSKSPVHA